MFSSGSVASPIMKSQGDSGCVVAADMGSRRSAIGLAKVIDLGAVKKPAKVDNVPKEVSAADEYPMEYVWDSSYEEAQARREEVCTKCSR